MDEKQLQALANELAKFSPKRQTSPHPAPRLA